METAEREIDLVLMTTNITRGISQRLPFLEGSWGQLFFNRTEFEALFPEAVVEHMWKKRAPVRHPEVDVPEGYYPLPSPADLPILLGARMSLSFPFLLGAVPLYAANVAKKGEDGKIPLQRCWFSDGGLTSNFPLHFFDAPLPSRPTFGINLVPASVKLTETEDEVQQISPGPQGAGEDAWSYIYMPSRNSSGIGDAARFNDFEGEKGSVAGFFGALFDTARNWADTELMAMPGYRDRIVHVELAKDEGGMNLNMKPELIKKIGERGEKASELLSARLRPIQGLTRKPAIRSCLRGIITFGFAIARSCPGSSFSSSACAKLGAPVTRTYWTAISTRRRLQVPQRCPARLRENGDQMRPRRRGKMGGRDDLRSL